MAGEPGGEEGAQLEAGISEKSEGDRDTFEADFGVHFYVRQSLNFLHQLF